MINYRVCTTALSDIGGEGKNNVPVKRCERVTEKEPHHHHHHQLSSIHLPIDLHPTDHLLHTTFQHLAHIHPNIPRLLTAVNKSIHIIRIIRVAIAIITIFPIIPRRAVQRLTLLPLSTHRHPPRHIRKRAAIPHALVAKIVPNATVRMHHVLGVVDGVLGRGARHLGHHAAVVVVCGFGHGVLLAWADFVHRSRGVGVAASLHGLEDEDGEGAFVVDFMFDVWPGMR